MHNADGRFQEEMAVMRQKFDQIGPADGARREREAGRSIDATRRILQGGLAAQADLLLLPLPSSSQPAGPSEWVNAEDLVGTSTEDIVDGSVLEEVADLACWKAIACSRPTSRWTSQMPSESVVSLSR